MKQSFIVLPAFLRPVTAVIFCFLLFFSVGAAACLSGQDKDHRLLELFPKYNLDITLAYDEHAIDVREKITVVNRTDEWWERLAFCAVQAVSPRVFTLKRFIVHIAGKAQSVSPTIRNCMLTVTLAQPVRPGAEAVIEIDYRLAPRRLDSYAIHPEGNLGYNASVLQAGDCFITLTPFHPGRGFREWDYAPVGDPYIYPLADYDVLLRTDPSVTVAAAGLEECRGGEWRFTLRRARSFAFAASRSYVIRRRRAGDIDVTLYFLKGFERQADVILQTAVECLVLFSERYGPYRGKELVIGHNAYASAMEYSNFITVSDSYIKDYTSAKPRLLLMIVAHEISHQWWYHAVGSDQVMEPWLDEALAKYSEYLYLRTYHPMLAEWWEESIRVERPEGSFVDDTLYDLERSRRTYSRVIYSLAPSFILALERTIGERAFGDFLRDYYLSGDGRFMTAEDFFSILSKHTDLDLAPLLQRYFRTPQAWGIEKGR